MARCASSDGSVPALTGARAFLGRTVRVEIDRPLGSRHPEWGFVYAVNYGFVPGVAAPDGEDLDAYVLGVSEPLASFTGHCIAVIHRLDDDDDKLVLAPEGVDYGADDIRALTAFQEQYFTPIILRQGSEAVVRHAAREEGS
jgi:inorganic pyrophosphatase